MPAHAHHVRHGAEFEDFGWQRPDWYSSNHTDREAAVVAGMKAVREAVGMFDASPLGKIDVAGPDARDSINKFYVSNLTTLKPGRIRYSAMCHDDGIIFEDGVITCINDNLFLAGSKARDLLVRFNPDFDISAEVFAHMQYQEGTLSSIPAREARVSFTGELQYEISVPARYDESLMTMEMQEGADLDATCIGMGVVVAEKQADFIGERALTPPGNASQSRDELVGLKPVDAPIKIGRRILADVHSSVPRPGIGNVTSVCDSPIAGNIAMALIESGSSRMGDRVKIQAFPDYSVHASRFTDAPCWLGLEGESVEDLLRQGSFVTFDHAGLSSKHTKCTPLSVIPTVILRETNTRTLGVERSRTRYLVDWQNGLTQSVGENS